MMWTAFYVDKLTSEVQAIEKYPGLNIQQEIKYYHCPLNSNTIIEVRPNEIVLKIFFAFKEIYLHFLLHINEDWDDDLLGDAMDLLT